MKKTYLLNIEGKNRDRLLEAAKHDIRKYVKRERAKDLPKGADFWDFDCKAGTDDAAATPLHFAELLGAVDAIVQAGGPQFYVEIVARAAQRMARPAGEAGNQGGQQGADFLDSE
jgi:hypothetical protein